MKPGWTTVALGDISRPKQWPILAKDAFGDGDIPVYGANGVIGSTAKLTHMKPTIAIGCRGSCGTVHLTAAPSYINGNAMALDYLSERVDAPFLAHYLTHRGFGDVISGSSQPQITRQNIIRVPVPLPPLEEQRRIATILDRTEWLIGLRSAAVELTRSVTRDNLLALLSRESWPIAPLAEIAATGSGGTPNRARNDFYGGGIPWVKSGEIRDGAVESTDETLTQSGLDNSPAKLLPPGTILLAMYGATAGVVGQLAVEGATNQAVCAISPGAAVKPGFLIAYLRSVRPKLLGQRSGGAQPNLSQGVIRALPVPLPPLELQEQFDAQMNMTAKLVVRQERHSADLKALRETLQERAFSGRL